MPFAQIELSHGWPALKDAIVMCVVRNKLTKVLGVLREGNFSPVGRQNR
jgi:hypothetical protein